MSAVMSSGGGLWDLFRPHKVELDTAARPSDGLVVFSSLWALAMMFSLAHSTEQLFGDRGVAVAIAQWAIFMVCAFLLVQPKRTWVLALVAMLLVAQYLYQAPVSSNNRTIAFFMNSAIFTVMAVQLIRHGAAGLDRDVLYERLRVVARALLAVMYFYGIFHKINTDFLDPNVSCAVALYEPLTRAFGLDQNIVGRYGAIGATFVVETITLVCLYWKRFFWVGLLFGLTFHYIIPISGYSWYMDFSSLVLALYMLSVPREVSAGLYATSAAILRKLSLARVQRVGYSAGIALVLLFALGAIIVALLSGMYPGRSTKLLWHSSWLVVWAVVGGVVMVLATRAALLELPYRLSPLPRQPLWVYLFPLLLFVMSFSPYVGLKTESSIAMFSNLHTEGGQTNHLLLTPPPYLFDYQKNVARVIDSDHPEMQGVAARGEHLVQYSLNRWLRYHKSSWVTYELNGKIFERATAATLEGPTPSLLERKFLTFKPVDYVRPKVCSH